MQTINFKVLMRFCKYEFKSRLYHSFLVPSGSLARQGCIPTRFYHNRDLYPNLNQNKHQDYILYQEKRLWSGIDMRETIFLYHIVDMFNVTT